MDYQATINSFYNRIKILGNQVTSTDKRYHGNDDHQWEENYYLSTTQHELKIPPCVNTTYTNTYNLGY